jgi:hypothetical protein
MKEIAAPFDSDNSLHRLSKPQIKRELSFEERLSQMENLQKKTPPPSSSISRHDDPSFLPKQKDALT